MDRPSLRIELLAGPATLARGWRRIEAFLDAHECSQREHYVAGLVFEEAVGNIFLRAPVPPPSCRVEILIEHSGAILMTISDAGQPFDPTGFPPPATETDLARAPDGGRGIHLMRSMARSMRYSRHEGRNWLEARIVDGTTVEG